MHSRTIFVSCSYKLTIQLCLKEKSPRWRGSVTRANISIHIANNKVTYE